MDTILKKLLNKPVHYKLTVMVMFITLIAVVTTCTAFISYYIYSTKKSMVDELLLVSELISKRIADDIAKTENNIADKTLEHLNELRNNKSIVMSCIYNNSGQIVAGYYSKKNMNCPISHAGENIISSTKKLQIFKNIKSKESKIVGSLYIESNMREIYNNVIVFAGGAIIIMFGVLFLSYFLVRQIQKVISVPIQNIAFTAQSVTEHGDYSLRSPRFYDDELGILADSFNTMMQEVEKTRIDLQDIVGERTKDLKEALIRAQSANKAKSEFLRNMSHEFRTPLHGMLSFASYGINEAKTADREELYRYFTRINQVAQRLLKLVEAILSIAQLESGKETFDIKPDDLMDAVQAVITEQQALLMEKDIEVEIKPNQISTKAEFDKDKMVQVITNIIGNAIKFSPSGKKIIIDFSERMFTRDRRRKTAPAICIRIADQGVGIPDEELEKIFEKFVQSSRTDTGAGGTGLGLSIAAGIVRAHEGEITAENSKEGGAFFTITIPREYKK